MFNNTGLDYATDPSYSDIQKNPHQDFSDISLDISEFARHLEESSVDQRGRQGLFDFGFNGDVLSPASPATIASTTDISGGDYLPPDTLSSQRSSISNNENAPSGNQIHRARSVSQPTAFARRKSNLSLSIPPTPVNPPYANQQYATYEAVSYPVNPMNGLAPAYTESPGQGQGIMQQDYFSQPFTADGDVMMSTDGQKDRIIDVNSLSKPVMDVRYGYRLPASQPSSPVRSGYPPGQAPYTGHHLAQGRPRGFTTSDVQGSAFFANMGNWRAAQEQNDQMQVLQHQHQQHQHQQHQQQQQQHTQQQAQHQAQQQAQQQQAQQQHSLQQSALAHAQQQPPPQPPASPFGFSPVEPSGYGVTQPGSTVGTPQSVQVVTMPNMQNGASSPYQMLTASTAHNSPHVSAPLSSHQQTSLQEAVAQMKDAHSNMQNATSQNLNAHFNQPTPVNFRMMTESVSRNPVPHLENQAMSYGGASQETQVDAQAMQSKLPPSAPGSVVGMSSSMMEEVVMDSQTRAVAIEGRRSSASVAPPIMSGLSTPGPAISGFAMSNSGARTPDISRQVQDKLSFLDGLANSVAQARQEILLGHQNAADEYITDVGNAIIEKALSPENIGNPTPSLNLQLPGLGNLVHAQQVPSIAPSPAASLAMTPINPGGTPNPPSSDPPTQPVLAPPFELKRSRSVKRSAPESPLLPNLPSMNKHIKLDDIGAQEVASAPVSAGPGTPVPGHMIHSHSFPDGQMPTMNSQGLIMGHGNQAVGGPADPTNIGVLAGPNPGRPAPVPSPLGHPSGPMSMDMPFATIHNFPNHHMDSVPSTWDFQPDMSSSEMLLYAQMTAFGQASNFGIAQQTTPSRRGSIVDGRLVSQRPGLTALGQGPDGQTTSTPVVPTLASTGQYVMPLSHASMPNSSSLVQSNAGPSNTSGYTIAIGTAGSQPDGGFGPGDSDSDSDDDSPPRRLKRRRSSEQGMSIPGALTQPPDLISPEIRAQLDIILFNFLNRVCSDLDFHDAKGELLHQTLMPKKMAKLDESPDFRPFKFRIQAFTNAFAEELQRLGVLEETLSAKKIKSYLWNQKLISRFNEDGKKSKSKGNHIWNVDAKKMPDGSWIFREFKRKIAPAPHTTAFVGSVYTWTPRVWDPQASTADLKVTFSSPPGQLPPWLSWTENVLSGMPTEDDVSVQVTALATFSDSTGVDHQLSMSFPIEISRAGEDSTAAPTAQSYQSFVSALPDTNSEAEAGFQQLPNPNHFPPGWPIRELSTADSEMFLSTSPGRTDAVLQPIPPQSYVAFDQMPMSQAPLPSHFHPGPPQ